MKIEKLKKVMKNIIKYLVFITHNGLRFCSLYGWLIDKRVLILQAIVITSWYLNNNKCLISQIEKYLFGETFLKNGTVSVDKIHRQEMYLLFVVGCLFNIRY